jgi:hypothetical protein
MAFHFQGRPELTQAPPTITTRQMVLKIRL